MPDIRIFSLLCHRDVELASRCLPSLVRHCRDPIELLGIDDGSLTQEDADHLLAAVPGLSIHRRCEIREQIDARLADYPLCRKYREWCPWATKLFDIPLYANGDFGFIDSDILFLRDFRGLENGPDWGGNIVSMHAYANVYSFALRDRFSRAPFVPLIARFNSGFLLVRRHAYDLDLIERFLHAAQGHPRQLLMEQTAWAVLAAHTQSAHFSKRQVTFPHTALNSARKLRWLPVAVHFVGGTRHLITEVEADARHWDREPEPAKLTITRSVRLTAAAQLIDVCSHRLLVQKCRRTGVIV